MDTPDIILWSASLILAVFGISFGIIASINSSRANSKMSQMLSSTWIYEEAQRFFFDNMQELVVQNRKIIAKLKRRALSFFDYSMTTTLTRMAPQSLKFAKSGRVGEFKDIIDDYYKIKGSLDKKFHEIIKDFDILTTDNLISDHKKTDLIKYHYEVIKEATSIIIRYSKANR